MIEVILDMVIGHKCCHGQQQALMEHSYQLLLVPHYIFFATTSRSTTNTLASICKVVMDLTYGFNRVYIFFSVSISILFFIFIFFSLCFSFMS